MTAQTPATASAQPDTRFRHRHPVALLGLAAASIVTVVASVAFACTPIQGFTWYSDGTFAKSGPSGTAITAFATNARANSTFNLVAGNDGGDPSHSDHGCMFNFTNLNANTRTSSASGFIGNTSGVVNKPAGDWQICFRQLGGASSTSPVFFTVIGG